MNTADLSPGDDVRPDDLYDVATALYEKAKVEREKGNNDASTRLLKAAMQVMNDDAASSTLGKPGRRRKDDDEESKTQEVLSMIRQGWQEVSHLMDKTGLPVNRVHAILSRLRKQGKREGFSVSTQSVKRYRIKQAATK